MIDRFTSQVNYGNKSKKRPENNEPEDPPKDTNALFACLDNLIVFVVHGCAPWLCAIYVSASDYDTTSNFVQDLLLMENYPWLNYMILMLRQWNLLD